MHPQVIPPASNILTCVYCGTAYPEGTPPHGSQVLTDHIRECEAHPMRAVAATAGRYRAALVGLVGSDDPTELRSIRDLTAAMLREAEARPMVEAINALLSEAV